MKKIYFISCIQQKQQIGAMQFECEENEFQKKSEDMCPERCNFRAYGIEEFDAGMPIDEFVPMSKMKELGY